MARLNLSRIHFLSAVALSSLALASAAKAGIVVTGTYIDANTEDPNGDPPSSFSGGTTGSGSPTNGSPGQITLAGASVNAGSNFVAGVGTNTVILEVGFRDNNTQVNSNAPNPGAPTSGLSWNGSPLTFIGSVNSTATTWHNVALYYQYLNTPLTTTVTGGFSGTVDSNSNNGNLLNFCISAIALSGVNTSAAPTFAGGDTGGTATNQQTLSTSAGDFVAAIALTGPSAGSGGMNLSSSSGAVVQTQNDGSSNADYNEGYITGLSAGAPSTFTSTETQGVTNGKDVFAVADFQAAPEPGSFAVVAGVTCIAALKRSRRRLG